MANNIDRSNNFSHTACKVGDRSEVRSFHLVSRVDVATVIRTPDKQTQAREPMGKRRVVVRKIRERDSGSFVAEAERAFRRAVDVPPGY